MPVKLKKHVTPEWIESRIAKRGSLQSLLGYRLGPDERSHRGKYRQHSEHRLLTAYRVTEARINAFRQAQSILLESQLIRSRSVEYRRLAKEYASRSMANAPRVYSAKAAVFESLLEETPDET